MSDSIFIGGPCHGQVKCDFDQNIVVCAEPVDIFHRAISFDSEDEGYVETKHHRYERRRFSYHAGGQMTKRVMHYMVHESLTSEDAAMLIDIYENSPEPIEENNRVIYQPTPKHLIEKMIFLLKRYGLK